MLPSDAHVLIIDNHAVVARLMAKIFGLIGISQTELAFDSQTAHSQLKLIRPDIVVIDANIAPTRAPVLIALVRALTDGRAVTILTTTSLNAEVVQAARGAGVDEVLLKPFTPNDLRARLLSAKAQHEAPRTNLRSCQVSNVALV